MNIRDRIVEFRRVKASELVVNPKNWRRHGDGQRKAYRALVAKVGFAGAELVRVLDDGRLMLIDGHMRKEEHPEAVLPVLVTDLDEVEADLLLASFDSIGAMATVDEDALAGLFKDLSGAFDDIGALSADVADAYDFEAEIPLADRIGDFVPDDDRYEENYGVIVMCEDASEQEAVYNKLLAEGYRVKVVVT